MTHQLEPAASAPNSRTSGGTPWVIVDERAVAIGATKGDGPIAVIDDPVFAAAFRRFAAPQLG
ncbi:MAG: hypothetical protein M5U19_12340 [Microthrixaceae bacterium]|nr:hypothetical protein [Microthrixaceae bacterium]